VSTTTQKHRRLPRPAVPHPGLGDLKQAPPPAPQEGENIFVVEMVELIQRVCSISRLSPWLVLTDWIGMIEASLRHYGENLVAYVTTGQFAQDPPETAERFRRARERYTEASKRYPSTYREMQQAFSKAFALLIASAGPGLPSFTTQVVSNPDVIGRVFFEAVQPGRPWWPFFPPWHMAMVMARIAIPSGHTLVHQRVAAAGEMYALHTVNPIRPEPGPRFEAWFEAILPYVQPIVIGPNLTGSSAELLAAAAQFPEWAVWRGIVQFCPGPLDPVIEKMIAINSYLYNLNGYAVDMIKAAHQIVAYYEGIERRLAGDPNLFLIEDPTLPPPPGVFETAFIYPDPPEPQPEGITTEPAPTPVERPGPRLAGPTFEDLFSAQQQA
jgi:hypothetical protein